MGKQPTKVKCKTELDCLKEGEEATLRNSFEDNWKKTMRNSKKTRTKRKAPPKKDREEANLTFKIGLEN